MAARDEMGKNGMFRVCNPRTIMKNTPPIAIVDDDESIRESLEGLLKSYGFTMRLYESAESFLESLKIQVPGCLLLDVRLEGMSGPELQHELATAGMPIPIIFMTAHGDEALRARLIATGAVDCLLKPFSEEELIGTIKRAIPSD